MVELVAGAATLQSKGKFIVATTRRIRNDGP